MKQVYDFAPASLELPRRSFNRRQFIYATTLALAGFTLPGCATRRARVRSPGEKLNIGIIGTGGKGESDSHGLSGENIVALCDVDAVYLAKAKNRWPKARCYRDYRVMLEREKTLDAVTVSTPDHHHAPAAMLAMELGRHVYCQKPLTHTIAEARTLTLAARARRGKLATQMGNQGHCSEAIRRLCEMIWSGAIGPVREVHCWTDRPGWPQGLQRPPGSNRVPPNLAWNLWLGPAPRRPYLAKWPQDRPVYHPFCWRGWWDFGSGALGDMGCHILDGPNWALKLGPPASVEVVESSHVLAEMAPSWSILRFRFPARGEMPECSLTWYDGGKQPPHPAESEAEEFPENGSLFIGDKGKIMAGTYAEHPRLLPESSMGDYQWPAERIERVPGNSSYLDFIRACKGGPPACSNFEVAGPFTETVLLGNLALRLGGKLEWDSARMVVPGRPEAEWYIHGHYRRGWKV